MTRNTTAFRTGELSGVGEVRRHAASLAGRLGFGEADKGRVGVVVTEVANNLVLHAREGQVLLRGLEDAGARGVEILAVDRGPGMADVDRCMTDGYSKRGTPGNGLGAIARMSDTFDIHSQPGVGTAVLSRVWAAPCARETQYEGVVNLAKPGQEACGDTWAVARRPGGLAAMVADGLGHGPVAALAATEALRVFGDVRPGAPAEALEAAHGALRATRGAAMAVADVDEASGTLRFAGVGNISGCLYRGGSAQSLVSHNGIVGHHMRRVHEFTYPWTPGGLIILHSDGLATQWRLDAYPGLAGRHPALVAGVLYRDCQRGTDDVTVLVVGVPPASLAGR